MSHCLDCSKTPGCSYVVSIVSAACLSSCVHVAAHMSGSGCLSGCGLLGATGMTVGVALENVRGCGT